MSQLVPRGMRRNNRVNVEGHDRIRLRGMPTRKGDKGALLFVQATLRRIAILYLLRQMPGLVPRALRRDLAIRSRQYRRIHLSELSS